MAHSEPTPWPRPAPSATACPRGLIADTEICDTPDAREVIDVCEAYRAAVERRDVAALLDLASLDYLDDAGTPDSTDDVGRSDLEGFLKASFGQASAVRYEIHYRSITPGTVIRVAVTYSASYRIGSDWKRKVDDSVLGLRREKGRLRFVSGM